MYEHVLVGLDGSEAAERVLAHAEALAGAFHSTVTLLQAIVSVETIIAQSATPGPGIGDITPPIDPTPIVEAERASSSEYLSGVAARLRAKGVAVNIEMPEGDAAATIVERAQALGVSLILMTTHGRGGLGRLVFGSTADAVLRHAACPVLLVRVHEES
ncbi:MAG TPA: universal stress protein [Chloroflexota bacterium]|jgi:nucleotide-binding universal stress UspA family protein